jgi:hypothetical protein
MLVNHINVLPEDISGYVQTIGDVSLPTGVSLRRLAVDSNKNIFFTASNSKIYKMTNNGTLSEFAGLGGTYGQGPPGDGGSATSAKFDNPTWLGVDSSDNVYVLEATTSNRRVRKILADGSNVSTIHTANFTSTNAFDEPTQMLCDYINDFIYLLGNKHQQVTYTEIGQTTIRFGPDSTAWFWRIRTNGTPDKNISIPSPTNGASGPMPSRIGIYAIYQLNDFETINMISGNYTNKSGTTAFTTYTPGKNTFNSVTRSSEPPEYEGPYPRISYKNNNVTIGPFILSGTNTNASNTNCCMYKFDNTNLTTKTVFAGSATLSGNIDGVKTAARLGMCTNNTMFYRKYGDNRHIYFYDSTNKKIKRINIRT